MRQTHPCTSSLGRFGVLVLGVPLVLGAIAGSAAAATDEPFTIGGTLAAPLYPGGGGSLNLSLTNPNSVPLTLTDLTVALTDVATTEPLACLASDFVVEQAGDTDGLVLPAADTITLSALGLSTAALPQVRMLDTPLNQNGCQGAILTLTYTGTAFGAGGPHTGGGDNHHHHDHDGDHDGDHDTDGGSHRDVEDDWHESTLPRTGGSGDSERIAIAGFGFLALGGTALYTFRRRKARP